MSETEADPMSTPHVDPQAASDLSRRTALKLLSATALVATGGLGCARKPERRIVSLAETPEYMKPGEPLYYATTYTDGPYPYGMMVKAVDGRPIKVEGLPGHPLNDGTSDAWMQATMLSLYDPGRLDRPMRGPEALSWDTVDAIVVDAVKKASKVLLVTRSTLGPSEQRLVGAFKAKMGAKLEHVVHETADDLPRRRAWDSVYASNVSVRPDLEKASVVLSLDSDFLGNDGPSLTAIQQFAKRRKIDGDPKASNLNRLYVAESAMTVTGSNADHRMPIRPGLALPLVQALRKAVAGDEAPLKSLAATHGLDIALLLAVAGDLEGNRGEAVVLAGGHLPEAVHAGVALLNDALDAPCVMHDLPQATSALQRDQDGLRKAFAKKPDVVLLLGVNPAYDLPGAEDALAEATFVAAHGLTQDETLSAATLALPSAHNLESWNDAWIAEAVIGLVQPVIRPLFEGRQEAESLLRWAQGLFPSDPVWKGVKDWHDFVRREHADGGAWDDLLRRGWIGDGQAPAGTRLDTRSAETVTEWGPVAFDGNVDLLVLPDPSLYDGRYAGNAWLLELPDPVTKLVWDTAAIVGPATARKLGVEEGDWLAVTVQSRTVELPVLVQPGTAPDVVVTTLGYGRTRGAEVAEGHGVSTAALLAHTRTPRLTFGAKAERVRGKDRYTLVRTQTEFDQHDRPHARAGTADEYREHNDFAKHRAHVPEKLVQMHDEWAYEGRKWGLAIDLSACIGCNACMVACQVENNISVVGKDECEMNRGMHWVRIDRYEAGDPENPEVVQQPMLCQQCDNAPCENVCPVNATAHSPEGLNEQAYNRCVGTRYCGNNCPYKVRRFNYKAYAAQNQRGAVQELASNPQVTVRSKGIMEKCTFCVQRINAGKFDADNEGKPLQDGVVKTACEQACPASAIVFGDLNDEKSRIKKKREADLAYLVLEELNVRPNVSYLAKVRNPHPGISGADILDRGGHG